MRYLNPSNMNVDPTAAIPVLDDESDIGMGTHSSFSRDWDEQDGAAHPFGQ
jgi:hypothetical protein